MGRFLVSWIAGVLVIVGGWVGWTHSADLDAAMSQAAGLVTGVPTARRAPSAGPQPSPEASGTEETMSTQGSPPGEKCDTPGPTGARGMNHLIDLLDYEPTLKGGDHGGSIGLADGRRMFVFGDTVRDTSRVSPFLVRNSALIADGGCLSPVTGTDDGAVIPGDSAKTGYWPMSLRADSVKGGTRVQVVTNRVVHEDQDTWVSAGSALATFAIPTNRMPRLVSQVPLGPETTDPRDPTWGAAMWDHEGHTYLFGTASNQGKTTTGWSLHVARTTPKDLAKPTSWEYWDGSRWVTGDPEAANDAALIPAKDGVSHVLSVFVDRGSWYALSKEGDVIGESLTVWKSPSPTGPFTKHRIQPLLNSGQHLRYTALAHPDFDTASGRLLVSWSEMPATEAEYVDKYRPQYDEITLP